MSNVRPKLAETEEAAAGGMDDRMVRLERLVENLSSEIVKLARPPPSQAPSTPGTSADVGSRAEQGGLPVVGAQGPSRAGHHVSPSTQMVGGYQSADSQVGSSQLHLFPSAQSVGGSQPHQPVRGHGVGRQTSTLKAYKYTTDLLALAGCRATNPWRPPEFLSQVRTPLRREKWRIALAPHLDRDFVEFILEGLESSFRVGFDYQIAECAKARGNMTPVCKDKNMIPAFLNEECLLGRVVGPLDPRTFPSVHCSPIGLVPKGSTGKWRLIVDLSSPHGRSVNDGIDPALCSLEYVTVDLVADVVASFPRSLLSKINICSAYRMVPVHPEDRWLLGMLWEGQLFVDTVLPFGLRSAPKLFTAVADAVEWIAKQRGIQPLFHYLDDFQLVSSSASGAAQLDSLLEVFADLGLPLALEKLEGPVHA
eukprot:Em0686g3a